MVRQYQGFVHCFDIKEPVLNIVHVLLEEDAFQQIFNFMLDRTASSSGMFFSVSFLVDLLLQLRWARAHIFI